MHSIFSGNLPRKTLLIIMTLVLMAGGCGSSKPDEINCPDDPRCGPATDPQTDHPQTDLQTEPQTDPRTEPQTDSPTEPQTDPPTEPQADPPTEPQADPPTEPQADPPTEPQADPPTEPPTAEVAIQPGTYHIYEERFPPCSVAGFTQYDLTVDQQPGSNVATVIIDNQVLDCNAINANNALYCRGRILFENGRTFNYGRYDLIQQTDGGITGEAEFDMTTATSDYTCSAETAISTYEPDYGTIHIVNRTEDIIFNFVSFRACDSEPPGENELADDVSITPGHGRYFRNITPACYDISACNDREVSSQSLCAHWDSRFVVRGETQTLRATSSEE